MIGALLRLARRLGRLGNKNVVHFVDSSGWPISVPVDLVPQYLRAETENKAADLPEGDKRVGDLGLSWTCSTTQMRRLMRLARSTDTVEEALILLAAHTPLDRDHKRPDDDE